MVSCPGCAKPIDAWGAIYKATNENFMLTGAFNAIGARTTIFMENLKPGVTTRIDFTERGVPKTAIILNTNYTPGGEEEGAVLPLESHGNAPIRDPVPSAIGLYGVPLGRAPPTECLVAVAVTWIDLAIEEVPVRHLVDAAKQYSAARYDGVIVPSNIAVESALALAAFEAMSGFCSKERAEDFLENACTYSHQLNVLVPMLLHFLRLPPITDDLRGRLNRLRRLRNDIVHEGRPDNPIDRATAAELLCAAVFGYHFARNFLASIHRARDFGLLPVLGHSA
jgi:hypothetical protein